MCLMQKIKHNRACCFRKTTNDNVVLWPDVSTPDVCKDHTDQQQ